MTNGDLRSLSPSEAVDGYLQMLQRHLDGVEYPKVITNPEVNLDLTREALKNLDLVELSELSVEISGMAFAVGDEYNRQKTKAERSRGELVRLVGRNLDHTIYGSEDKWMTAAFKNPEARQYWEIRQNALTVCLRLEGQAARLSEISKAITHLIFARR